MRRADIFLKSISPVTDGDPVPEACARLVNYILTRHKQLSEMLSFRDLSNISELPVDSAELIRLISLATTNYILKWRFTYIADEHASPVYMSDDDSRYFINHGIVRDEDSGLEIENAADRVYPYFEADADFLRSEVK